MKIAVFVSGRGSNFRSIFQATKNGILKSTVALLVSNNPESPALDFAKNNGIEALVIDASASISLKDLLLERGIDLIVLAGYLKKIPENLIHAFPRRILNIHPSLLPKYGGKGFYGLKVHESVLQAMEANPLENISGATVHFVDANYDTGPILLQREVSIEGLKTAEEIAAKVLEVEHELFIDAIKILEDEYEA